MKIEDIQYYITPEDVKKIAFKKDMSLVAVQQAVSGKSKRSKCIPLLMEYAELNKKEAQREARALRGSEIRLTPTK